MENLTVTGLRSRSRSNTPFLRSTCDHENCIDGEDHSHKSGRKTPVRRSTPIKQFQPSNKAIAEEDGAAPTTRRKTVSTRTTTQRLVKTSDYSSEDNLDTFKSHGKEVLQNEINRQQEKVSTSSQRYGGGAGVSAFSELTLSPIHGSHSVNYEKAGRAGSPTRTFSACSSDSSFAEQALSDVSLLLDREPTSDHLPSRLYRMSGEYWNKYPKTDYTYSVLSRDRVELAPGQVAVPNMSRRSLSNFRLQGPNTSEDEVDQLAAAATSTTKRTVYTTTKKSYTTLESSDDELSYMHGNGRGAYALQERRGGERWWIVRLWLAIVSTVTAFTTSTYRALAGTGTARARAHRYPYTDRAPARAGVASRAAGALVAPFRWAYLLLTQVVTTTTTTTETTTNHVTESEKNSRSRYRHRYQAASKRSWWPWLLLLVLPFLGYGSYYTYQNVDQMALPNFTDFQIDLSEFSATSLPKLMLPDILNLTLPDINITLPDISDNLPEVTRAYHEYKDIVHNRLADVSDYIKVVMDSCLEEVKRYWRGVIG